MSNFDISVIIPVYNTEEYLAETIESVLIQSIGLERIQVILIDDGSTDNSAVICEEFQREFPDNIVFIQQENSGVSAARNAGLDAATGRYIAFLDSDDVWAQGSFEAAVDFFENHGDDVDLLCGKLALFEKEKFAHPLDYKYTNKSGGSLIALNLSPCDVQSTIGNCIVRAEAVRSIRFETRFNTSEDTLFVCELLLNKGMYGVMSRCKYLYRKRADGSSLSQRKTPEKHLQNLDVCKRLAEVSTEKKGAVVPFVQADILYIINWLLFGSTDEPFTEDQRECWYTSIQELLQLIDDELFDKAKWLSREKVLFLLQLKYGKNFAMSASWVNGENGYFNDICFAKMNTLGPFYVFETKRKGEFLHLEGTTTLGRYHVPYKLYAKDQNGLHYSAKIIEFPRRDFVSMPGDVVFAGQRFVLDLPLKIGQVYTFHTLMKGETYYELKLTPHFSAYGVFNQRSNRDYCVMGNVLVEHTTKQFKMREATPKLRRDKERARIKEIMADTRYSKKARQKYVALRMLYHAYKRTHSEPIWLFADKEWKAGDNAENVYRYAVKRSGYKNARMMFALEKTSSDYDSVASYGNVVDPQSSMYKLYYLLATTIVSSRCELAMVNPFGKKIDMVKDLMVRDFVYLTHGTLFGDLSSMLNRPDKAIDLFCVSTSMEHDALLRPEYGYDDNRIELTGMARYDGYDQALSEKMIAFLPTWRADIAGSIIPGTSTRKYVEDFKETEYCQFYTALINDARLREAMKRYGYRGEFYVHPAFEKQAQDFVGNDQILVGEGSADYERVLANASLLVTDYSGVAFDFGYQRKPIVYSQYDSIFDGQHTYGSETYFDYDSEGFGPVARSLAETVDCIIEYMKHGCTVEDKYKQRADSMFGYSDYDNCKRIFESILAFKEQMGRIE